MELEPTIYHTRCEHDDHYTTGAVNSMISIHTFNLTLDSNKYAYAIKKTRYARIHSDVTS